MAFSFEAILIVIATVCAILSDSKPLCAYINFDTGFGTPLYTCHPVYNEGILRSYEYVCQNNGYYEIEHSNHLCTDGPLSRATNITENILYGDCHDSVGCDENIMEWISFINNNCTENYNDAYETHILLINECMAATKIYSTPATRAAMVYCNDEFFQIGYFGNSRCEGGSLTFPQRFYFDQCNEEGFPNEYYKLEKCTDPIGAHILNKYPYKNGTKADYDKFVQLFQS